MPPEHVRNEVREARENVHLMVNEAGVWSTSHVRYESRYSTEHVGGTRTCRVRNLEDSSIHALNILQVFKVLIAAKSSTDDAVSLGCICFIALPSLIKKFRKGHLSDRLTCPSDAAEQM